MGQPCMDTSYGPAATAPSFPPKSSDFPQVGDLGWAARLLEVLVPADGAYVGG